mgnify:CR=1 FL=1
MRGEHNSQILSKTIMINVIVITSTVHVVDYIEEKYMRNDIRSTDAKSTFHKMVCNGRHIAIESQVAMAIR